MNEITIFNFDSFPVRIVKDEKGEPWFVAKDVAEILEYSDIHTMIRRLDDDEKGLQKLQTPGGSQNQVVINESGLYNAIIGSSKPEAKRFKKWITSEVLPSIRKTGGYITTAIEDTPDIIMARALQVAQATLERHQAQLTEANNRIKALAPDATYAKTVLSADNLHTVNSIAVHLGISAIRLNKFLEQAKWIYRQGGNIFPASDIRGKGYCDFHIVPYNYDEFGNVKTREHLKWTEEGRRAIINLWETKGE